MPVSIDLSALLEECLPGSEHKTTRAEILGKLAAGRRRVTGNNDDSAALDFDIDLMDIFDDDDDDDSVFGDLLDFSEGNDRGDLALVQKRHKDNYSKDQKLHQDHSDTVSTDDESESTTSSTE